MIIERLKNYYHRNGLTRTIFKIVHRIGEFVGFASKPAYEQIQSDFINNLHRYIGIRNEDLQSIFIIGAHTARELPVLKRKFRNCEFHLFEPYPEYFDRLSIKYQGDKFVKLHHIALGNEIRTLDFHQTNLDGSGSILEPSVIAKETYNMKVTETIKVKSTKLTDYCSEQKINIPDVLWIDVQGYEWQVLSGISAETFQKINAIFIEIAAGKPIYDGQFLLGDISDLLNKYGYCLVGLGTDPINLSGNAIFIKQEA